MEKELQKDVIAITVTHDNAYAFNAVYRAICEAAEKEAFSYHVRIEISTRI